MPDADLRDGSAPAGRPEVEITPGTLHEAVDAAVDAMAAQLKCPGSPRLYQRGGRLVRVVKSLTRLDGKLGRPEGALSIAPADVAHLRDELTRMIDWRVRDKRMRGGGTKAIDCPAQVAASVMTRSEWPDVPVLIGTAEAPTLRADGSILDAPGYDKRTGILLRIGPGDFPPIPRDPSKDDAIAALRIIEEPLRDFPFTSEAGRAVALAAMLTGLIRRTLEAAPLFGFSAPTPGAGKTLLAQVIAIMMTGRVPAVVAQVRDDAEQRKLLFAALLAGDQVILIDNCKWPLGGTEMCAMLTSAENRDRFLGRSEMADVPTNALFLATGNALAFHEDITRRALMAVLNPQMEHPEHRPLSAAELRHRVLANRSNLVVAGLTILRAFHCAGRPSQGLQPLGSFEPWSDWVRSALVWLDHTDPVEMKKAVEASDSTTKAIAALLAVWHELFGDVPTTTSSAVMLLDAPTVPGMADPKLDALRSAITEALPPGRQGITKSLGWLFRGKEGRIFNGLMVEGVGEDRGRTLWKVSAVTG